MVTQVKRFYWLLVLYVIVKVSYQEIDINQMDLLVAIILTSEFFCKCKQYNVLEIIWIT